MTFQEKMEEYWNSVVKTPEKKNTVLWRYMDFPRYVDMLMNGLCRF